jgi:hypothetical protein
LKQLVCFANSSSSANPKRTGKRFRRTLGLRATRA